VFSTDVDLQEVLPREKVYPRKILIFRCISSEWVWSITDR